MLNLPHNYYQLETANFHLDACRRFTEKPSDLIKPFMLLHHLAKLLFLFNARQLVRQNKLTSSSRTRIFFLCSTTSNPRRVIFLRMQSRVFPIAFAITLTDLSACNICLSRFSSSTARAYLCHAFCPITNAVTRLPTKPEIIANISLLTVPVTKRCIASSTITLRLIQPKSLHPSHITTFT